MLKEILPETKIYTAELYGHKWEIEVKIISYKAKQEYIACTLRNKKVKQDEIEVGNITANDLLEGFKILFFSGLIRLSIDGQEEQINQDTYKYLIDNLANACDWLQQSIMDFNGNFFLAKK